MNQNRAASPSLFSGLFLLGLLASLGSRRALGSPENNLINEIFYHAAPSTGAGAGAELEYIELFHRGAAAVDVSGWRLIDSTREHTFRLPAGTLMAPGEFLVLAHDAGALRRAYGGAFKVVGNIDFFLGNGGDTVRLFDAGGRPIDRVEYGDSPPWPVEADGRGAALERLDPGLDIDDFSNVVQGELFRRGEANGDGRINIGNPIAIIRAIFLSGEEKICHEAADGNDDGAVEVGDALYLLRYLFLGGTAPLSPFMKCGLDPTADGLPGCKESRCK